MECAKQIYGFTLVIIMVQSSATRWNDRTVGANAIAETNEVDGFDDMDETEFEPHIKQVRMSEQYETWSSCLSSKRPRKECHEKYESILREERPVDRLKHYHVMTQEMRDVYEHCLRMGHSKKYCITEKKERHETLSRTKRELYPWMDIHEMCVAVLPAKKCYEISEELHVPRYRTLVSESLITLAKAHICLDQGRSEEECEAEAMDHFNEVVAPKDEL